MVRSSSSTMSAPRSASNPLLYVVFFSISMEKYEVVTFFLQECLNVMLGLASKVEKFWSLIPHSAFPF